MPAPDPTFTRRLLRWYDRARRSLPWRVEIGSRSLPDPYLVLISETMLQQTQVATVIPYFHRFLLQFPTLAALAQADEQQVLRSWQGLGYYSRARNLQAAAKLILRDHGGELPRSIDILQTLPGVGRYTAGAISSLAYDRRAPILDGNVQRVLCRLDLIQTDPRDPKTREQLWKRAEEILPHKRLGDFNSALMELGATVCTPRSPQCLLCPVREHCRAFAAGLQEKIPAPRTAKQTPLLLRRTYCIRHGDRWLIEQRPPTGRWAGMWQFITIPAEADLTKSIGPLASTTTPEKVMSISHTLTHRRYQFEVFICDWREATTVTGVPSRRWMTLNEMDHIPLPRPHVKIAQILRDRSMEHSVL
ncbi:MAG TPA: A/G-specific adenine glycosylase [Tepidisphaeraceae bacterium]|jgi:A/G-specific adenine glycosylase|nr:A/G-specific adenine glycosylase [Tepidisphaeraceae bacterium]